MLVESTFKEAELDISRKKEEVLSKIRCDIKEAKASTDDLLPTISAYKELQTRTDTISFIEVCLQYNIFKYILVN